MWGDLLNAYLLREHFSDGTHNVKSLLDIPASSGNVAVSASGAIKGFQWRSLNKHDVGLGSIDNTPDAAKPVSGPQQAMLDTKQDRAGGVFSVTIPVLSPTAGAMVAWRAPFAAQLLGLQAYRAGGSGASVNARKNGVDNHLTTDLSVSVADAWVAAGTLQLTNYAAGDTLEVLFTAVNGSPTQLVVQLEFVTV